MIYRGSVFRVPDPSALGRISAGLVIDLFRAYESINQTDWRFVEEMNSGDTAFMLVATAMVMLMTPGLALFYGGLVRSKNVLSTTMQSFFCLGIISILWVGYGYSLSFGPDIGGFIGGL